MLADFPCIVVWQCCRRARRRPAVRVHVERVRREGAYDGATTFAARDNAASLLRMLNPRAWQGQPGSPSADRIASIHRAAQAAAAGEKASAVACVAVGLLALAAWVAVRWKARGEERAACQELVAAYYSKFAPEKLADGSMGVVLKAYGTDQGALRAALESKYGALKSEKGKKHE
jgi:hypothetical protein